MAKVKKKKQNKIISPFKNYWSSSNYTILSIGIVVVIIGFILMSQGPWDNPISLTLSPIVLLIAYIVIFPLSILYKKKKSSPLDNVSSEN